MTETTGRSVAPVHFTKKPAAFQSRQNDPFATSVTDTRRPGIPTQLAGVGSDVTPGRSIRSVALAGGLSSLCAAGWFAVNLQVPTDGFGYAVLSVGLLGAFAGIAASVAGMALDGGAWRCGMGGLLSSVSVSFIATLGQPDQVGWVLGAAVVYLLIALPVRAARRVRRENTISRSMERMQVTLCWCVPFFGPLIVLSFYGAEDSPRVDDGFDARPGCHGYD